MVAAIIILNIVCTLLLTVVVFQAMTNKDYREMVESKDEKILELYGELRKYEGVDDADNSLG
jgi:low affinity Fe/Cu permease